jgi:hypothetical protein
MEIPFPKRREAAEAQDFRSGSEPGHTAGEELRRRAIAPIADGTPL